MIHDENELMAVFRILKSNIEMKVHQNIVKSLLNHAIFV